MLAALNSLDAARKAMSADSEDTDLFQQGLRQVIEQPRAAPCCAAAPSG